MDFSSISSTLYSTGTSNAQSAAASSTQSTLSNLSSQSSEEEMKDAIVTFESYFVEQILKEAKETFSTWGDDEDEDSSMSQITDMYMDNVYQDLAKDLVEDVGSTLTQQLYEQMKRNYNITDASDDSLTEEQ